jgi:uncharacterized membrane protein YdjX (TVP38/TMEM64 family)
LIQPEPHPPNSRWRDWGKPLIFLAAAALLAAAVVYFRESLVAAALEDANRAREWCRSHPIVGPAGCIAVFAIGNGFSLPPLFVVGVTSGWLFGLWGGLVVASCGAAAGAMVAFLASRYLLRDAIVDRWPDIVEKADRMAARDGVYYVLSLRLLHVFPGWLVNLTAGCTAMRVHTFWLASQLGLLPGTILYVYAGQKLHSLTEFQQQGLSSIPTPGTIAVFVLLALVPLCLRAVIRRGQREG